MTFTHTIPFVGSHSSIVIGKRGSTIKQLQDEFGCFIKVMKPDKEKGLPLPYFIIEGTDERAVNHVIIKIQGLILRSMCRSEKELRSDLESKDREVQHLNLVVADRDEQITSLEGYCKIIFRWKPIKQKQDEESEGDEVGEKYAICHDEQGNPVTIN